MVALVVGESLQTPLTIIDEVAPDRTTEGFGGNGWGWFWFNPCGLEGLTLFVVSIRELPIPDVKEVIAVASSSDDLLIPRAVTPLPLLSRLALSRSI